MDFSLSNHRSFIGRPALDLPTPSLILSRPVLQRNIKSLLQDVNDAGIRFRPHVKTLKSIEGTRMMLGGTHRSIVASTVCEIRGVIPLVEEGLLDECLYGLPIYASVLPQLMQLSERLKVILMVDNEQHIDLLEKFASETKNAKVWDVFIKIDVGSKRAGVVPIASRLPHLIRKLEASSVTSIYGFYCHAGHSYACKTPEDVEEVLHIEVKSVAQAAKLMESQTPVVLSVGATPTAHALRRLDSQLPPHLKLELHAGNYVTNDLQQLSTTMISENQQGMRVICEVSSIYSERNEALINAGVIALSRESSNYPGFGYIADAPEWSVVRLSQEHGILGLTASYTGEHVLAENVFRVGQKVFLYVQHACITAAAFHVYYVVDENDIVQETWIPWKGW